MTKYGIRDILDKLTVSQPVTKFPAFCLTRSFIAVFTTSYSEPG